MQLTEDQKRTVARWVEEGCGLAEIQKRLAAEFKLSMTYLDVRFLLIDLGLEIKEQPTATSPPSAILPEASEEDMEEEAGPTFGRRRGQPVQGGVTVTLDRVQRPGALVSGSVVFSDGVRATWALDQFGRLAIEAQHLGYSPSESDIRAFQDELRRVLERRGF
ncbi:MAG: hypothetical protein N2255_08880 [Kiritimatiellae bacterium]|nr:hypothetical protein [Kiritimatiellia bacterium]